MKEHAPNLKLLTRLVAESPTLRSLQEKPTRKSPGSPGHEKLKEEVRALEACAEEKRAKIVRAKKKVPHTLRTPGP